MNNTHLDENEESRNPDRSASMSHTEFGISIDNLWGYEQNDADLIDEEIRHITENTINSFRCVRGWAPDDVSLILETTELDRIISLTNCLKIWNSSTTEGELILAWVNLGSLVEGFLKLFLIVYLSNYREAKAPIYKKKFMSPDICMLNQLRMFCKNNNIWSAEENWNEWISFVQRRRNAIHAFQPMEIGTFQEWQKSKKMYYYFIASIIGRFPDFPD